LCKQHRSKHSGLFTFFTFTFTFTLPFIIIIIIIIIYFATSTATSKVFLASRLLSDDVVINSDRPLTNMHQHIYYYTTTIFVYLKKLTITLVHFMALHMFQRPTL